MAVKEDGYPIAYKGKEPYIFISYAHKDAAEAMGFISRLQQEGCRVWYDGGIDPGAEWDQNIASHINDCAYFIAVISENYMASSNCKDELSYARDLEKPRLLIYLQETTLPAGMSMRMNRIQAIHKYTYPSEEAFYEKVFEASGLRVCQAAPDQAAAPAFVSPASEAPGASSPAAAAPQVSRAEAPAPEGSGRAEKKGGRKGLVIGIAAAVAAVVLLAGILGGGKKSGSSGDAESGESGGPAESGSEAAPDRDTLVNVEGFVLEWGMTREEMKAENGGKAFIPDVRDGVDCLLYQADVPFPLDGLTAQELRLWFGGPEGGLDEYTFTIQGDHQKALCDELSQELGEPFSGRDAEYVKWETRDGEYAVYLNSHLTDTDSYTYCSARLIITPDYCKDPPVSMDLRLETPLETFLSQYGDYAASGTNDLGEAYYTYYKNLTFGDYTAYRVTAAFAGEVGMSRYYYAVKGDVLRQLCDTFRRDYGAPLQEGVDFSLWSLPENAQLYTSVCEFGEYPGISTQVVYSLTDDYLSARMAGGDTGNTADTGPNPLSFDWNISFDEFRQRNGEPAQQDINPSGTLYCDYSIQWKLMGHPVNSVRIWFGNNGGLSEVMYYVSGCYLEELLEQFTAVYGDPFNTYMGTSYWHLPENGCKIYIAELYSDPMTPVVGYGVEPLNNAG